MGQCIDGDPGEGSLLSRSPLYYCICQSTARSARKDGSIKMLSLIWYAIAAGALLFVLGFITLRWLRLGARHHGANDNLQKGRPTSR